MTRRGLVLGACVALGALGRTGHAQSVPATPQRQVEVLGLRRWTVQDLRDSLAHYSPETPLEGGGCEEALRGKLRFPEASVLVYYPGGSQAPVTLVAVVEPSDSARVRWRLRPQGATTLPASWRRLAAAVRAYAADSLSATTVLGAVQGYSMTRAYGLDSTRRLLARRDSAHVRAAVPIWRALARRTSAADRATASRLLRTSRTAAHRALGIAVLLNFPTHDATWHDMLHALRDPDPSVRQTAFRALWGMRQFEARPVDWRPAVTDARALLGGTHLTAYFRVVDVLEATAVDPALAPALLGANGALLVEYAHVQFPLARRPARALLARLSGRAEPDSAQWAGWLRDLSRDAGDPGAP